MKPGLSLGKLIHMEFHGLRQDYNGRELVEANCPAEPNVLFRSWFEEAIASGASDMNAMVLSTASLDGWPSGRVVLLKELDHGFVWYSNYDSNKGKDLMVNPRASLTFWWEAFSRQVRMRGFVEKVAPEHSDAYFHSRPLGSRAGAIASAQSQQIESREVLENRYLELLSKQESELKRPENWGGYRLIPDYFEFWQGRESRMHDRIFYKRVEGNSWNIGRLSP